MEQLAKDFLTLSFALAWQALKETALQAALTLGAPATLGLAVQYAARSLEVNAYRLMGARLYLLIFGWLGTIVHEGGHLLFCLLFGHRIRRVKWFETDPAAGDRGYVEHAWNKNNLWHSVGNFFIGIGPLLSGALAIYGAAYVLLGVSFPPVRFPAEITFAALGAALTETGEALLAAAGEMFAPRRWGEWRLYLFLYIAFSVGSSVTLSGSDLKGAWQGGIVLALVLFCFNIVAAALKADTLSWAQSAAEWSSPFVAVMLFALVITSLFAALAALLRRLLRR